MNEQRGLQGKLIITAQITLITGMHIGASSDFSAIGAVDHVVVRDPLTKKPIIPGSSIKGKMRTLLARTEAEGVFLKSIDQDSPIIKRMFGSHKPVMPSRLQFYDIHMNDDSVKYIEKMNTDLYLSEIKFENSITRTTCVANPRQIERVPAGAKFDFKLVYNIESESETLEDMQKLAQAFELLSFDYLGGHGSRGYGKVAFSQFQVQMIDTTAAQKLKINCVDIQAKFDKAAGV